MNYKWQILELSAENEVITHAKYHLSLSDDTNTVETEGNNNGWISYIHRRNN